MAIGGDSRVAMKVGLDEFTGLMHRLALANKALRIEVINGLLADLELGGNAAMVRQLKAPIPFTAKKAWRQIKARPRGASSEGGALVMKDIQAQYLELAFGLDDERTQGDYGTTRIGALIPIRARLNASGNFPGGPKRWLARRLATGRTFTVVSRSSGQTLLLQRKSKSKVDVLAYFAEAYDYEEKVDLEALAKQIITKQADKRFASALLQSFKAKGR